MQIKVRYNVPPLESTATPVARQTYIEWPKDWPVTVGTIVKFRDTANAVDIRARIVEITVVTIDTTYTSGALVEPILELEVEPGKQEPFAFYA